MEKALPKLQAKYDKDSCQRAGLVGKAKEDKEYKKKNLWLGQCIKRSIIQL